MCSPNTETGRTFIVSTHIIEEAANVFEKVIILDQGRLRLVEDTAELISRFFAVSGKEEEVDAACATLKVHHSDMMGRSKTAYVELQAGDSIKHYIEGRELDAHVLSLQRLFVAMCGDEAPMGEAR